MTVKTHTFKLSKYIVWQSRVDGWTDEPSDHDKLYMLIPPENSFNALWTSIHESLHAEGIPAKYLDGDYDCSYQVARFLWRLEYRRKDIA